MNGDPPEPERRTLRLGNPFALLGILGVGFMAMLIPDAILYVAIERGAAPAIDAIRDGATVPFPVMATTLVVRQATLLVGSLAVAVLATGARDRRDAPTSGGGGAELGFARAPAVAVVAGALGVVGLGPMSEFLIRLLRALAPGLEVGVLEQISDIAEAESMLVLWPLLALLPGVAEETYFRGLVQRTLGRGAPAIIGSGFIFAVFHLDPVQAVGVLPIGFYLAWLAERTRSLWVPIAAHVTNNSVALLVTRAMPDGASSGTTEPPPPLFVAFWLSWTLGAIWTVYRSTEPHRARR